MRTNSHETWIGIIRRALELWYKRDNSSMVTVSVAIIEKHIDIGGQQRTGIRFEPASTDPYTRMTTNSERIWRWLDETKDKNLLGVPFAESIIAALPEDLRLACVSEMLARHCQLAVRLPGEGDVSPYPLADMLQKAIKESSEAMVAIVPLLDGANEVELLVAQQQLAEAVQALAAPLKVVEAALAKVGK